MPNSHPPLQDLAARVRWYVKLRWFYLLALSVPGLVGIYLDTGFSLVFQRTLLIALVGLTYNGLYFILARRQNGSLAYYRVLGWLQLLSDILLATYVIASGGGIESRAIIIYAIPIIIAGSLFTPIHAYLTAAITVIAYDAVIFLDWLGLIRFGDIRSPEVHGDTGYLVTSLIFYSAAIMIIAAVSNFVTRLLEEREHEIRNQALSLASAQHIAHLGSWEWDIKKNKVAWSDELYRIFGLDPKEFKATFEGYLAQVHPEDRGRVKKTIEDVLMTKADFSYDARIIKPNKEIRHLHADGRVITGEDGEAIVMAGTAQDVTDRIESEQELLRRTRELEKINQLMIGRELKMAELKEELQDLKRQRKKQ